METKWGSEGIDLLEFRSIRRLVTWHGFPYVFQVLTLAALLSLAYTGWGLTAPEQAHEKIYAKSNLTTLAVWGLWWPSMVWGAVLFGRVWCTFCPLELISNLSERLGRRAGVSQKQLRRWAQAGWMILVLYIFTQLLVAMFHLHRSPAFTAYYLLGLLGVAVLTGLFLKDRAFCRGFCPAALLLAAYGRSGMVAVRARSDEKCGGCDGKNCLLSCNRTLFDGRSCPSLLNPPKLNSNRDCLVCGQCIKSCVPDNMRLLLRAPFSSADAREPIASLPMTLFVIVVSGFVTMELCAESHQAEALFLWLPNRMMSTMGIPVRADSVKFVWSLFVAPFLAWTFLWGGMRLFGDRSGPIAAWRSAALPAAVVIAAGHMAKGLAKLNSWAGFLPSAWHDPSGQSTLQLIREKTLASPAPLFPVWVVSVVSCVLLATGLCLSVREARLARVTEETRFWRHLPNLGFTAVFTAIVLAWALPLSR